MRHDTPNQSHIQRFPALGDTLTQRVAVGRISGYNDDTRSYIMGTFVRAVITGFGFSLGKMLFDKAQEHLNARLQNTPAGPDDYIDVEEASEE